MSGIETEADNDLPPPWNPEGVTIGITGTREVYPRHLDVIGRHLPDLQRGRSPLTGRPIRCIVTGACEGIDAIFGECLAELLPHQAHTVVVPADRSRVVWWWSTPTVQFRNVLMVEMKPGTSYMDRNDVLVGLSDEMLAFSNGPEKVRSGTWATVRRARKKGIPLRVVNLETGQEEESSS